MASELVDFLRCELVAAVVEESLPQLLRRWEKHRTDQQGFEGFEVGGASVQHEGAAPVPVQLVDVDKYIHDFAVDGDEVHRLREHAQRKHSLNICRQRAEQK